MKWNKIETVTGGTKISLPSSFNEILVEIKINSDDALNFTYVIPRVMLKEDTFNEFRLGYYTSSSNYATCNVAVNLSQAYIANSVLTGNNKLSTSTLTVYYR